MHFTRALLRTCVCVRALTARLPGSIHGDFDGAVVGGHLWGSGEHGDGQSEALSCRTVRQIRYIFIFYFFCICFLTSAHYCFLSLSPPNLLFFTTILHLFSFQIISGFRPAYAFELRETKEARDHLF